jgi:hypothetical protein
MCKKLTTRTRTVLTLAAVVMAILGLMTTSAKAGLISYVHITNDADCGISTDKTYTHKLDFGTGSPGALINGVQFNAYNNAANGTLNFNREVATGLLSDHAGNTNHNVSGGLVDLLTDMYYNGNNEAGGTTTWTLSGLTAGQLYNTRIYTRQWGVSSRTVTMVFDLDGAGPISDSTGVINEDDATTVGFANANDAYYINYQFTAVAGEDLVITLTQDIYNESWHLYGLTNEIAGPITKAYSPTPKDGAQYTDTWVSLSWRPSDYAVSHDVYLGDNFDDVNNATHDSETFRGNQPLKSTYAVAGFTGFPYPDGLVPGKTYYWRIDEVNEAEPNSPWKGDVWSFWVPSKKAYQASPADGLMYIDPDVILTWTPGLGSKLHFVYFGENFDDVNNAAGGPTQVNTAYTPGHLELGKTYYWRVDESDGLTTLKGDVWSFTTLPDVPISDLNLVGWWKLDEGYGATTVDWSGYGNHGVITNLDQGLGENGSVWFDDPDRGMVLSFNGNDSTGAFVTAGGVPEMTLTNDFTWAFWARQHEDQSTDTAVGGNNLILGNRYSYTGSDPLEFVKFTPAKFEFYNNDPDYLMTIDYEDIPGGVWIHHAGVKKGTTLTYYRNGVEAGTSTITKTIQANPFYMAGEPAGGGRWEGWLSDVRLYNKALTIDEVRMVMRGDPLLAWNPSPANGSTPNITEAATLSWSPGDNASQHDVYFGIDRDAVANANASDTTGIYKGRQTAAVYSAPDVEWGGGLYYWRIDEYNGDGSISKGKVWHFTVTDFIGIDDFEDYNAGENQIWYSWKDGLGYGSAGTADYYAGNGTGAAVGDETTNSYTEETIVHGGHQSMPLSYDNNKQGFAKYSETEMTLTDTRDWTEENVAELSIWFRGYPGSTGSFVEGPTGTFTMTGSGADIWDLGSATDYHDEFHFAYKMLSGAGSITAKVVSVEETDPWAKAGVMIRETLDADSAHAFACVTPGNGVASQYRPSTGAASGNTNQTGVAPPYWVKLERSISGLFTVSQSTNGTSWQPVTGAVAQTIPMTTNVYIGLAVTAHNASATCQAVFSNVTTTGNVTGQWADQDIGIPSNDAEPLYVALSNSNGTSAVITNDDPAAAQIDTWTEWVIPLSAFADQGINLANVNKIAIGLGTQGNMTIPGGSGKIYIDDIRLYRPREVAE